MSKNDHMHASHGIAVGKDRQTRGPVSLTQGVYGARGNLELVACGAHTGLWVFWFNADLPSDPPAAPDVPAGSWSAGLQFAPGRRYVDAVIMQSTLGPDHLEVLALDAQGTLWSWYWSPGPGFQCRERPAATGVGLFAAAIGASRFASGIGASRFASGIGASRFAAGIGVGPSAAGHDADTVRVSLIDRDGAIRHLVSGPSGYPHRSWAAASTGPSFPTDDEGRSLLASAGIYLTDAISGTVRTATSTRDGGTAEITWRDGAGDIRHLAVPAR